MDVIRVVIHEAVEVLEELHHLSIYLGTAVSD